MNSADAANAPIAGIPGLVSVVVPVYNREGRVAEAVESLRAQTWKNFEAVVVDDGSTDATADVVAALAEADPRVRLVRAPHGGVSAARNRGMTEARGELIAFLDSDDVYMPRKLESQAVFLLKNKNFDAVYSPYIEEHPKQGRRLHRYVHKPKRVFIELFRGSFIVMNSLMFRARLLETAGMFREDMAVLEDIEFFLRLAEKGRFGFVDEISSVYRMNDRGVIDETGNYFNYIKFLEECRERYEEVRANPKIYKRKYGKVLYGLAKSCAKLGRWDDAIARARESLALRPQPDVWLFMRRCEKKRRETGEPK